jgi:hypothetical protein
MVVVGEERGRLREGSGKTAHQVRLRDTGPLSVLTCLLPTGVVRRRTASACQVQSPFEPLVQLDPPQSRTNRERTPSMHITPSSQ